MKLRKTTIPLFEKLLEKYVEPLLVYVRKNCVEPVVTVDNNLVGSFFRLLDCWMYQFIDTELKKITAEETEILEGYLEGLFIFCCTWTLGATTNLEGRNKFNIKLKEFMGKDNKFKHPT